MKAFVCVLLFNIVFLSSAFAEEPEDLLNKFLAPGADVKKLTMDLRPQEADYKAFFNEGSWKRAMAGYEPSWTGGQVVVSPKKGQTKLLLFKTTKEELQKEFDSTGSARHFPGNYSKALPHLKPGVLIYSFKFVKAGETSGMAFDGLTFVNNRWVIFFKPWRVLE